MPKRIEDTEILNIISAEMVNATGSEQSDEIESNRRRALSYYLGLPNGKEIPNRSTVISTDVCDAIEWIMPQVINALTATNEVVTFDPLGPQDERQAELESKIVYDVLMKENQGFITLHYMAKDALMQKNGFVDVYYSYNDSTKTEEYTGLTKEALEALSIDENIEIINQTFYEPLGLYDVKIIKYIEKGSIIVEPIPQEEFRISRNHRHIDISEARFAARILYYTRSELKLMGISDDVIDELSSANISADYNRRYRNILEQDSSYDTLESTIDKSQELYEVAKCVLNIDLYNTGISQLCQVLIANSENPSHVLLIEEIEESPFINCVAIMMSHSVNGFSIYDRLREIQEQKTALLRSSFDNIYLQNNQRMGVIEGQVRLDDLMISRPGGVIRMKRQDALFPIVTSPIGQDGQVLMEYLDRMRAGRVGVSPEGNATPQSLGDRIGSDGIERLMNVSEMLVNLIIRVIAETGVKPLCLKIRNLLRRHRDVTMIYQSRGDWIETNPSKWEDRVSTSIRVGIGSGDDQRKVTALSNILSIQEKLMQSQAQPLVTFKEIHNTVRDYLKALGIVDSDKYFINPESQEGQQQKQQKDQQMQEEKQLQEESQKMIAKAQVILANAEELKARADLQANQVKLENERIRNQLENNKQQSNFEIATLNSQLDALKAESSDDIKRKELDSKTALELTRLELEAGRDLNEEVRDNTNVQ